jgi:hypothetical protein
MRKKDKKLYGIGVNDADYAVTKTNKVDGKQRVVWKCPYYTVWCNMLHRCYYEPYSIRYPTYKGCSVCEEWIHFSNFKSWMETQDFEGKELDKDILVEGNKIYSAETCRFVTKQLNYFLTDHNAFRGDWPLGVIWQKHANKFRIRCSNPFTKKQEHLGYLVCPNEAHELWKKKKHEHACALADLQTDADIAEVLRNRFRPS